MNGWEGKEQPYVCPGLSPVLVCSATLILTYELRSISGYPILEAALEVTTVHGMSLTCYGIVY